MMLEWFLGVKLLQSFVDYDQNLTVVFLGLREFQLG